MNTFFFFFKALLTKTLWRFDRWRRDNILPPYCLFYPCQCCSTVPQSHALLMVVGWLWSEPYLHKWISNSGGAAHWMQQWGYVFAVIVACVDPCPLPSQLKGRCGITAAQLSVFTALSVPNRRRKQPLVIIELCTVYFLQWRNLFAQ